MILDHDDIILWRRRYLWQIRKLRQQKLKIYYLDETWVNEGHHLTSKSWSVSAVKTKKQVFLSGLSTGIKNPSGKGKRHIGSDNGFMEGGDLVFEWEKKKKELSQGYVFKSWFERIIPKLEPNNVVVMDNAPYHSVKSE